MTSPHAPRAAAETRSHKGVGNIISSGHSYLSVSTPRKGNDSKMYRQN